jgi:hypothetical protein
MRTLMRILMLLPIAALCGGAVQPSLKGTWLLEHNRLRSTVSVEFTDGDVFARAGCLSTGRPYVARQGALTYTGAGIEPDGSACRKDELPGGWGYWREILDTMAAISRYQIDGDRLILSTPDGSNLEFVRSNRAALAK